MVLEKYFGFAKLQDEFAVVESLIEHLRIDEEELILLSAMIDCLCSDEMDKVEDYYSKIHKICTDSSRIFEHTVDQIVQAEFCYQRQYDLLRLYQRVEGVSELILAAAKRVKILAFIGGKLPVECKKGVASLMKLLADEHAEFRLAFDLYQNNKKKVLPSIHRVEEIEQEVDQVRAECLVIIYKMANEGKVKMGDLRAIENVIEFIEETSDKVAEAAASLEWLLMDVK